MRRTHLILIFLIVQIVTVSHVPSAVATNNFPCLVCPGHESLRGWSPQYPSINMSLNGTDAPDGLTSLRVVIPNATYGVAVGVAYDFGTPVDLSSTGYITLSVNVRRLGMISSLYLSVGDSSARWRQFEDFGGLFALESEKWTRVAIDLSDFVNEGPGFNMTSVKTLWFGSYDAGNFGQSFSLENIRLEASIEQSPPLGLATADLLPRWLVLFSILFTFALALPFGVLASKYLGIRSSNTAGAMSFLPIQLALGISAEAIVLLLSSLVVVNTFIVIGIWAVVLSAVIIINRRSILKFSLRSLDPRSLLSKDSAGAIGTLASLGISVYLLSGVVSTLGWAPPNDSFIHSMVVSLILFNHHLGPSFSPISSISLDTWGYSRGFYGLPSALSFISGFPPGQSTMIVAAALVCLLPSLLYSATFLRTKSPVWATVSFFAAFFLPQFVVADQWLPSNDLLLGSFLVSTYPSLMGNVLLLSIFAVIVLFDDFSRLSFRSSLWLRPFLLLTACLVITYYPYVLFPILYLLLRITISTDWRSLISRMRIIGFATVLTGILAAMSYLFIAARNYSINVLSLNTEVQYQLLQTFNPLAADSHYLPYALLVLATIFLGLSSKLSTKNSARDIHGGELFFAILLGIHILSLSSEPVHTQLLWMTNPSRSLIVLYALTYIMIPLYFFRYQTAYLSNLSLRLPGAFRHLSLGSKIGPAHLFAGKLLAVFLIFLAFSPMIVAISTYAPSSGRPDMLEVPHDGDYLAAQWIVSHAKSEQLILNDLTLSGLSLTSFSALHVVNDMQRLEEMYIFNTLPSAERNYILEADSILQHPGDYQLVNEIMLKYNIKYIFISDGSRSVGLFGSGVRFAPPINWQMTQLELLAVYLGNPFLRLAYRVGNAAVFEPAIG